MLNQLSLLTIALTGAAMLREREHGTIEHLMVMPLTPVEVALSKVFATMAVVLAAFIGSLLFVVQGVLQVPVAGSVPLLVAGAAVYLWAAAAIGMFQPCPVSPLDELEQLMRGVCGAGHLVSVDRAGAQV